MDWWILLEDVFRVEEDEGSFKVDMFMYEGDRAEDESLRRPCERAWTT
jgi:hypothetical protein